MTYSSFKGGVQVKDGQFTMLMSGSTSWSESLKGKTSTALLGSGTITVSGSGVLRVYGDTRRSTTPSSYPATPTARRCPSAA